MVEVHKIENKDNDDVDETQPGNFEREKILEDRREIFEQTKVHILSDQTPKDIEIILHHPIGLVSTEKYKREVFVHEEECIIFDVMDEAVPLKNLAAGELKPKPVGVVPPWSVHVCLSKLEKLKITLKMR